MSLLSSNLRAFLAVSRISTVLGASKELGLSQTGVTQRIRALEREIGVTLFVRSRSGMRLTYEGEALLQYCLTAEEMEGKVLSIINRSGKDHDVNISIAGPTSIMNARIIRQCSPLYINWPKLNLSYVIDDRENRLALLKTGKVEFVLLRPYDVPHEVDSKLLQPEKFILVGHPRLKARKIQHILAEERIIDFSEEDPRTINYLKSFGLAEYIKRPRLFTNNNETLLTMFCSGIGLGTLTQEVAQPFLAANKLVSLNSGRYFVDPIALAWYPRPEKPDYFEEIIRSIK